MEKGAGRGSFPQCVGNSVESAANQGFFAGFPQGKLVLSVENLLVSVGNLLRYLSRWRKNRKSRKHLDSLKCIILCKTVGSPREIDRREENVQKKSDTLSSRMDPGVVSPGERINVSANIVYVIRWELYT